MNPIKKTDLKTGDIIFSYGSGVEHKYTMVFQVQGDSIIVLGPSKIFTKHSRPRVVHGSDVKHSLKNLSNNHRLFKLTEDEIISILIDQI